MAEVKAAAGAAREMEGQQAEDVREFIELLKSMDEKSKQRTMGYMDALKSFGGQVVQIA